MRKYELTEGTKTLADGTVLHRIRALMDISRYGVNAGDIGGWIEAESNLSQYGNAWVSDDARVYGEAWVNGNAVVRGDARVYGGAWVNGNAEVSDNAEVKSIRDYAVFKNGWSSGRWFTYTRSNRMWRVGCFHGTGEELISKAYKDSELSGKCYEAIVRAQKAIDKAIEEGRRHEMSNERHETLADIVREIRQAEVTWHRSEIAQLPTQYLKEWADRIEAAEESEAEE